MVLLLLSALKEFSSYCPSVPAAGKVISNVLRSFAKVRRDLRPNCGRTAPFRARPDRARVLTFDTFFASLLAYFETRFRFCIIAYLCDCVIVAARSSDLLLKFQIVSTVNAIQFSRESSVLCNFPRLPVNQFRRKLFSLFCKSPAIASSS